jgi:hypothetical protein
VEHGANGRLVFSSEAAIVEMPEDVGVGINPARRNGQTGEVVSDRTCGRIASNSQDLSAFNDDDGVAEHLTLAVEHGGRL